MSDALRRPVTRPRSRAVRAGRSRADLAMAVMPVAALAVLLAALSVANPRLIEARGPLALADSAAPLTVLAAGATVVVLCGGIDLSVAALASLASVLLALWLPPLSGWAVAAVIGVTALAGAVQGTVHVAFRIPSFVVTLGGMTLWCLADLLERDADHLAQLESLDNGKLVAAARDGDVATAAELCRYLAGWATKVEGTTIPMSSTGRRYHAYTRREPVGVVAAIVPWNFPLLMACFKVVPALAAGNTVVLKPAEQTPLSALWLGGLLLEAGLPPGVVNVLPGYGDAGAALAAHPDVDKVGFTGSTEAGKLIVEAAAGNLKKVSLELGGKAPNIVFADADLDAAVAGAVLGGFFNEGQCCVNGSRLYVERPVFDRVVEGVAAAARAATLGRNFDTASMGPLVSQEQLDKVLGYVRAGMAAGAVATAGGADRAADVGYYVRPTVLTGVAEAMPVQREEIFGPVVTALPFDSVDEVVAAANDTRYGLAAGVWTRDIGKAHRVASSLRACTVWLNAWHADDVSLPRGGYKESGWGRELGAFALDDYTELKTVIADIT